MLGTAWDQRGFWGGLGNSLSLVAGHYKDAVAGTPGCNANVEFALPDYTDGNGVTVSGFADDDAVYDAIDNVWYFTDIHTGSTTNGVENSVAIFSTTAKVVEGTACSGAKEGKAKNAACVPNAFPIFSSSYNITMNTGVQILRVRATQDSSYFYTSFLAKNLSAGGTTFIDGEQCKKPVTGPSSCTLLGGFAFNPDPGNPIFDFAITPNTASGGGLVFVYTQGSPLSQTLYSAQCTLNYPSSPLCGTPTAITTYIPLMYLRGQQFTIGPRVSLASSGGTAVAAVDTCTGTPVTTPQRSYRSYICGTSGNVVWTSMDGGKTWSQFGSPSQTGSQFLSSLSTETGSFDLYYLTTRNDKTNQSFTVNLMKIPTALTTPTISTLTTKAIDPSSDFSTGGSMWGPPQASVGKNGVIYLHFATTNAAVGTWGPFNNQGRETNADVRVTFP